MIQEIKYSGFTAVPSDYECPDGELAAALNLIPEDGALHPVAPPLQLATLPQEVSIGHIHKNVGLSNYIFKADFTQEASHAKRGLYWLATSDIEDWPQSHGGHIPDDQDVETMIFAQSAGSYVQRIVSDVEIPLNTINKIDSIGNTLVLLTSNGTFFFLWKNGAYVNLGEKPAPISVRYYVTGPVGTAGDFWATSNSDTYDKLDDEVVVTPENDGNNVNKLRVCADYIFSAINRARSYARKANLFLAPFFIRLAYRTISGAHIMHTAPFLVVPNTTGKPFVWYGRNTNVHARKYFFSISPAVRVDIDISAIPSEWEDIIEGIDIFITPEIQAYSEDPAGIAPPRVLSVENDHTVKIGQSTEKYKYDIYDIISTEGTQRPAGICDVNTFIGEKIVDTAGTDPFNIDKWAFLPLQHAAGKSIDDLVREEHRFYLYKTLTPNFFGGSAKRVQIALGEQGYESLTTREQLDDDYLSRDGIIASNSYVYNNRLNLVVDKRRLGKPDYLEHYAPMMESAPAGSNPINGLAVEIEDSNGTYITHIAGHGGHGEGDICLRRENFYYFYYPNSKAKALYIKMGIAPNFTYEKIPLLLHPTLNGAYTFNGFKELEEGENVQGIPAANIDTQASLLYTSEVNMPFIFPARNITQVGTGEILALSSATKALSQGQFGQFPLYAFTTEGVWALSVGSDGAFAAKHPVTRDVIRSAESLVQTDDSVIFAAQRGIMLLQGSSAACISEVLDSVEPFSISSLLTTAQATSLLGGNLSKLGYTPFRDFLAGSEYLYDYTHQRVVVYNDAHRYAYVFSMRSKEWGIIESNIIRTFGSYPYALAETSGGLLLDYAREQSGGTISTCLVTRPLKLGGADMLKTIDAVMQRGYIERGDVKSILFGSRDLVHWVPVWSSVDYELRGFRGTPYKYFRVMLIGDLSEDRSLYGMSVSLDMRQANKLR